MTGGRGAPTPAGAVAKWARMECARGVNMARVPIGEMLIQQGRLDAAQLQSALGHQQQWGGRLGGALVVMVRGGVGRLARPAIGICHGSSAAGRHPPRGS